MSDLTWTDEPPTKEGWYWYRDTFFPRIKKTIALIVKCDGEFWIERETHLGKMIPGQWAGPIPEPKERGDV